MLKLGSRWEGQVISIDQNGGLKTDIRFDELKPLLATSKIWFDIGVKNNTIRGVAASQKEVDANRLAAFADQDGYISFCLGAVPPEHQFLVGDKVIVHFRV